MNTGETIALIKAFGKGGGSSLPPVTSSDNGKVLAVKDGAWAADSNLFVVNMPTYNTADKTYDETVAALEAGKTVMVLWNGRYYSFLERTANILYFVGNEVDSTNSSFGRLSVIKFQKSSISITNTLQFLNKPVAADNGSELIVKNGEWAMQKKKFVVTLTPTAPDYSGTMDKTVAEINAAYEAGQQIVFRLMIGGDTYMDVAVTATVNGNATYPSYNAYIVDNIRNVLIFGFTGSTDDGTKQTYSTKVYSLTPAS